MKRGPPAQDHQVHQLAQDHIPEREDHDRQHAREHRSRSGQTRTSTATTEFSNDTGKGKRYVLPATVEFVRLLSVPLMVAVCFALVVPVRIITFRSAWRADHPGERFLTAGVLGRIAARTAIGGAFGFVLITAFAAVLFALYHGEVRAGGPFAGLGAAVLMILTHVVGVPIASRIGLHILTVRPAGLATAGAWALLGLFLYLAQRETPGGRLHSPWFYGLWALIAYTVASAAAVCVPTLLESEKPVPPHAARIPTDGPADTSRS
jgi:hypothetical protein